MKRTLEPTATAYLICVPGANMYLVAVIDSMLYYPEVTRKNEI
jgi:hypothetical protein